MKFTFRFDWSRSILLLICFIWAQDSQIFRAPDLCPTPQFWRIFLNFEKGVRPKILPLNLSSQVVPCEFQNRAQNKGDFLGLFRKVFHFVDLRFFWFRELQIFDFIDKFLINFKTGVVCPTPHFELRIWAFDDGFRFDNRPVELTIFHIFSTLFDSFAAFHLIFISNFWQQMLI